MGNEFEIQLEEVSPHFTFVVIASVAATLQAQPPTEGTQKWSAEREEVNMPATWKQDNFHVQDTAAPSGDVRLLVQETEEVGTAIEEANLNAAVAAADSAERTLAWLRATVWPNLEAQRGQAPSKEEQEALLGF